MNTKKILILKTQFLLNTVIKQILTHEDFVLLKQGENSINVAQFIYEFAFSFAFSALSPNDENGKPTCNPEMLKILEKYSLVEGKDENVDPWLSQLSDIKIQC